MKRKTGMTAEVRKCLAEMGVTEAVMAKVRAASNHTDGQIALDEAKEICRKGFRTVALKYHPDHNQGLPPEEIEKKSQQFKRMKSIHDDFMKAKFVGSRRRARKAAANFDPFGYAAYGNETLDDELRYWNDPIMLNFVRMKRDREYRTRSAIIDELKKREFWGKHGLDYDEMRRRDANGRTVTLAGGKGVYFPDKGRWVTQTRRPKKSDK